MAEISAKDIAALRKQTGAGMLDCRTALQETGGDIEAAKDWLRTKGLAGAAKRAGREAQDGAVEVTVEGSVGAIVELNCETDFVAKGAEFRGLVETGIALSSELSLESLLRRADELGCDVVISCLPIEQGIGAAVADRLRRAASRRA